MLIYLAALALITDVPAISLAGAWVLINCPALHRAASDSRTRRAALHNQSHY